MDNTQNMTHPQLVAALVKDGLLLLTEHTPSKCHLDHMVLGVAGEAGELVDAIKKHTMYNQILNIDNVEEELGDLEFFMEGIRVHLGITREQTLAANIKKLLVRYNGMKYSNAAAQERADKK